MHTTIAMTHPQKSSEVSPEPIAELIVQSLSLYEAYLKRLWEVAGFQTQGHQQRCYNENRQKKNE